MTKKKQNKKHKGPIIEENGILEPFSVAPLDQDNPYLRMDPRGSAAIMTVIISVGLIFMFVFGLWAGHELWG